MADLYLFRTDHQGSMVRPSELVAARSAHAAGSLSAEELRAVENRLITESVLTQRDHWLSQVSDGEFRRDDFRDVVLKNVAGFSKTDDTEADGLVRWECVGAVSASGPLAVDEAQFIEELTGFPTKVRLPSAAYLANHTWSEASQAAYATPKELGQALVPILRAEVEALLAADVKYIQFENPDYSVHYAGVDQGAPKPQLGILDAIEIDAAVIEGLQKPEDARVGIVVDWGQYPEGEVDEQVAFEVFNALPYERFTIPYFSDAFAEQELLQFVPEGTAVCLTVVDSQSAELEDIDSTVARLERALAMHDIDQSAIGMNRGFQDAAYIPAALTEKQQWKKLVHLDILVRMIWGNEA